MDLGDGGDGARSGGGSTRCSTRWCRNISGWSGGVARRPAPAARRVGNPPSVAAAMMLHAGLADAAICGGTGAWWRQIQYILPIIPRRPDVSRIYGLSCLDPADRRAVPVRHLHGDRSDRRADRRNDPARGRRGARLRHHAQGRAGLALQFRRQRQRVRPQDAPSAGDDPGERAPALEIDGEMHADAALVQAIRDRAVPDSRLSGSANLLIMPTLDAANIAFNMLKAAADGLPIGPMLLGMTKPIHVVVPSVTARGIVNLSALAVVEAQAHGMLRERCRSAYEPALNSACCGCCLALRDYSPCWAVCGLSSAPRSPRSRHCSSGSPRSVVSALALLLFLTGRGQWCGSIAWACCRCSARCCGSAGGWQAWQPDCSGGGGPRARPSTGNR